MHNKIKPFLAALIISTLAWSANAQAKWKLKATLLGHTATVWSAAFYPDSRRLVTSSGDGSIRMWDVITAKELKQVFTSDGDITDIAVSPDGTLIAACMDEREASSESSVIKIWDAATLKLLHTLPGHEHGVFEIVFSPQGNLLASGGRDSLVKLWNARTGELIRTMPGHVDAVTSLAFTPNGKKLFTGSAEQDKTVKLWDVATGRLLQTLSGHEDWVTTVGISPDAATLVSGSRDKNLVLWNANTGARQRTLKQTGMTYELEFSPDGKTMVTGGDELQVYDTRTWTMMDSLKGHSGQINDVKFSPNGKLLVSAGYDNTVKVWELER